MVARRDSGSDPSHEQASQTSKHRGDSKEGVEDHRTGEPDHKDGAPADPIGQPAPPGRKEKLHGRETGHQQSERESRLVHRKLIRINREQRQNHPKPEQIDEDRQEDHQQRAGFRRVGLFVSHVVMPVAGGANTRGTG